MVPRCQTAEETVLSEASFHAARWRGASVLVISLVMIAGLAQTSAGHVVLQKLGLFKKPAAFTSLAFSNPRSLPAQINQKRTSVSVSFVIRNVSGTSHDYAWRLLLSESGETRTVATGGVRIGPKGESRVSRRVRITCTAKTQRNRIVVDLVDPAESVYAWSTCSYHGG